MEVKTIPTMLDTSNNKNDSSKSHCLELGIASPMKENQKRVKGRPIQGTPQQVREPISENNHNLAAEDYMLQSFSIFKAKTAHGDSDAMSLLELIVGGHFTMQNPT